MSKLTLALLLVAFALSFPRSVGATNYHEYKKFDPPVPTERVPCKCRVHPKERWNCHCDKRWEFYTMTNGTGMQQMGTPNKQTCAAQGELAGI
jgi:hypothetical protein